MSGILKEHIDLEAIQIRPMRIGDLDQVLAIEEKSFSNPWKRDHFLYEIKNNKLSESIVMEYNGQIIGYAICWHLFEEFHLANIAIAPEYRGLGLGEYLFDYTLSRAQNEQYYVLEVRVNNLPALKLYQKKGFSILFTRKNYYPDGEDAFVMVKHMKSGDNV
ncbi:MAG: ribosomal-protein-alanine N-acetyltransferase [Calditrichaeota bacterium]|nr:MAG: ribosomal-protein-alanine N-acetyltransferase [Calditrichota bacterium]